jgi:RecB family endonuclease NucS
VLERYRNFRLSGDSPSDKQPLVEDVAESAAEEAVGRTFQLESDLQKALRANLAQLEAGLTIADEGKEYRVEAGYIDILARDKNGAWVVIELKAGDAKPDSVAQILSYMSCIAEEKKGPTRGILIASDFVPRVRWAVRSVSAMSLQKYRFNFAFDKL